MLRNYTFFSYLESMGIDDGVTLCDIVCLRRGAAWGGRRVCVYFALASVRPPAEEGGENGASYVCQPRRVTAGIEKICRPLSLSLSLSTRMIDDRTGRTADEWKRKKVGRPYAYVSATRLPENKDWKCSELCSKSAFNINSGCMRLIRAAT